MKYSSKIIIEIPLTEFIEKFDNTDNLKHWQRGLISTEHISGTPGEFGCKMKYKYKLGKQVMELIETITHKNLPYEFHAMYDTKNLHNIQENYFEENENGHTVWISKNEFFPLAFSMRLMIKLMPSAFKKQSKLYMTDFKNFAEKGISVINSKS